MSKPMIRTFITALSLLCAGPALAQQQGQFDLPETATPAPAATGNGQAQGPVDDSGIIPIGPRVIGPTATPSATPTIAPTATPTSAPTAAPTPAATATRQPAPATTQRVPTPRPAANRATPDPRLQPPADATPAPTTSLEGPSITDPIGAGDGDLTSGASTAGDLGDLPALPTTPGPIEAQSSPVETSSSMLWWISALFAAIAALVAAAFVIRRKQAAAPIVAAPKASPGLMPAAAPKARPAPEAESEELPAPSFVTASAPAQTTPSAKPSPAASRPIAPLGLETQLVRMQRSLRAVTVTAQVTVTNRGTQPIANAVLQGDLVGASAATPLGEQLANAAADLEELEDLGTLAPGERREATVEVRRELPEIEGIRQGNTVVFIPLLRVRFAGDGATPLASTVLVGHPPERSGGKPTPFLADAPPQNYNDVVGRALG